MNNKGADQNARLRKLVCAFDVSKPPNTGFLAPRPIYGCGGYLRQCDRSFNQDKFVEFILPDCVILEKHVNHKT